MAGITLTQAETELTNLRATYAKLNHSSNYSINGNSFTSHTHAEIRAEIEYWENKVKELTNRPTGRIRGRGITFK
jgi:hypothetical protein